MYTPLIPLFKQLITILGSLSLLLGGLQQPRLGATNFNPTGGGTYRLQSSIGLSDTSLTLSSFKEPISNIKYTMSYLNSSIEFGTLEPANSTKKEFVSFSGITQNGDGTATLTGLIRGLSFSYPYTASTTLQQSHSGQSIFILSNPPQLTNQYANKTNSESINPCGSACGVWTFASTSPPQYDANVTTSGNQFVSFNQLNATAIQGAGTSTESALGLVRLVSGSQVGNGTASSTSGAPLVLTNKYASSTYNGSSSNLLVVTGATNQIDANFIATSSAYNFGSTIGIGTSTPALGAKLGVQGGAYIFGTTTVGTLNNASSTIQLNGQPYSLPSSAGAASTTLINNGSGGLTWNLPVLAWATGATTTKPGFTGNEVIIHGLGRTPTYVRINATQITNTTTRGASWSIGTATSTASQFVQLLTTFNDNLTQPTPDYVTGSILRTESNAAGAATAVATLSAITSTTFTLNWTTNSTANGADVVAIIWEVY